MQKIVEENKGFGAYSLTRRIPVETFDKTYPSAPKTFGDKLRKIRIDRGLLIKDLAEMLNVAPDTVINWETRGMIPVDENMKKLRNFIPELL